MIRFRIARLSHLGKLYRKRNGAWSNLEEEAYHYPTRRHAEAALGRMDKLNVVNYGSTWVERIVL